MTRENFPKIRKCLLSASAQLIAQVDQWVPMSDTIVEDQWAPVVSGLLGSCDVLLGLVGRLLGG